jgi:hypothetical protein
LRWAGCARGSGRRLLVAAGFLGALLGLVRNLLTKIAALAVSVRAVLLTL